MLIELHFKCDLLTRCISEVFATNFGGKTYDREAGLEQSFKNKIEDEFPLELNLCSQLDILLSL